MKKLLLPALVLAVLLYACNSNHAPLPTVPELDVQQYAGTWYEIARLPNRFEKGLECVTATYTVLPNGKIEVRNKGHKTENPSDTEEVKGKAHVPDPQHPGRLKVTFFWPFSGDYWILDLAPDYSYSLVGEPSRENLWILSRTPEMDEATYTRLLEKAKAQGFPVEQVQKIKQDCR